MTLLAAPAVIPSLPDGVHVLREQPVTGAEVPHLEVTGWAARFGVVAGITTRAGLDGRPFDLGLASAQPIGEVLARWRALRELGGEAVSSIVCGRQVHATSIHWHHVAAGWTVLDGIDGHATADTGVLLAVLVADCIPVYLVDPRSGALALLHAGWRGTAGGILPRAVALLAERAGSHPSALAVHLGVGISGPAYEVGREVVTGCGLEATGSGPWYLDLRAILARQAVAAGVRDISVSPWCSASDRELFFSHRGSGGSDGRMAAFLGRPTVGKR